ncbi:penicillin-binding protein [Salmonella enterica subsp. enterica]|uniref:Penicillin-binding protein n=1 Tax=Salmonella enterica I TaxID=59201 RepID=A0A447U036_SALET|nr:penicillin-binding protein [Salmonella enterica subsp. enterica]
MVVLDARLPLDEILKVDISQTPEMKGVYSRVRLNSEISRKNMLLLALMSSEKPCGGKPGALLSWRL